LWTPFCDFIRAVRNLRRHRSRRRRFHSWKGSFMMISQAKMINCCRRSLLLMTNALTATLTATRRRISPSSKIITPDHPPDRDHGGPLRTLRMDLRIRRLGVRIPPGAPVFGLVNTDMPSTISLPSRQGLWVIWIEPRSAPGHRAAPGLSSRSTPECAHPTSRSPSGTRSADNEFVSVIVASRLVAAAIPVRPLRPQRPSWPQADNARFAMAPVRSDQR
jgi:hypothetical protein